MPERRVVLHDNDIRLSTVVSELSAAQWRQPSLCGLWTNHDVLAHLVDGYCLGPARVLTGLVRHRGSFDRANAALATERAQRRNPTELLADLMALVDVPTGLGRVFPSRLLLGDHVIHELDIILALGRRPTIPSATLIDVLNTQVTIANPFVAAKANARGLRLVADDVDWSHGVGPTVTGPAAILASVLAGRRWGVNELDGDGVATLAARLG